MKVVTRYAPSPTGNPHVGNIRTALFSYLFAKHEGGKFLLRIEDTDRARFVPESLKYIEDSLGWLGIKYDGEKKFQSDRLDLYQKAAEKLLSEVKAYKCFCTTERLEKLRSEQEAKKMPPGYDGACLKLSEEEIAKKEKAGESYVIRFKMPYSGKAIWNDLVRGKIEIDYQTQDDPIILKSDGWPTYHLANIVDDHEMGITHVIRGDEWIPSTPKHIAMYDAFGWSKPEFAHLPVILGPDKSKLSKRHGDTAILDFKDRGYLTEAMVNFLAFLGWNPGTTEEIFAIDELIRNFDIKKVQKAPAVFDARKLNWMNGIYIRKTRNEMLKKEVALINPGLKLLKLSNFDRILEVEKTRLETLCDISKNTDFYLKLPKYPSGLLVYKKSTPQDTQKGLAASYKALEGLNERDWTVDKLNSVLVQVVSENKLTNGDIFWPVRVALSGVENSPSPAELLWVFEKDESLKRIRLSLNR